MGMTDHEAVQSLLAPYALDAVDVDEVLEIEAHLDTCPECVVTLTELRETVVLLAALPEASRADRPDPALAARTMAAALAHRPARPVTVAPADAHLIESSRLVALVAALAPAQWSVGVGDAFPDWSVQDLVAHLAASEALLAELLGAPSFTPEVADQPTPRAHAAVDRHRSWSPAQTRAELERAYSLVQAATLDLGDAVSAHPVPWFGLELSLGDVLIQRAFEIWTHADDIRRALALPLLPPPAPSLALMSATAVEGVPLLLAAAGVDAEGRTARLTLDGAGGAAYDLDLSLEPGPAAVSGATFGATPDVSLELDVVDFCRSVADRLPADQLHHRVTGDRQLAAALVAALPGLAVL
jgi:uncharacterized protein (TIGR03083 family)